MPRFDPEFVRDTLTPVLAIIGAILGTVGTCLGILNYRLQRRSQKTNVRLDVKTFRELSDGKLHILGIDLCVVNDSAFDVTIQNAGLAVKTGRFCKAQDLFFLSSSASNVKRVPIRIQARHSETIRIWLSKDWTFGSNIDVAEKIRHAKRAFVQTATGKRISSKGAGLKRFKDAVAKADLPSLWNWNK